MKRVRLLSFGSALVVGIGVAGALGGCDAILGIPGSEIDGIDAAHDAFADGVSNADGSNVTDAGNAGDGDAASVTDADAAIVDADAGPVLPSCNLAADFGTPTILNSVSTAEQEGSPRLSEDEMTLTFDGQRADGGASFDVFMTTRTTLTDSFGPPVRIPGVDTSDQEYSPNLTADGLTLIFERQIGSVSTIMESTRAHTTDPFDVGSAIANINTNNYTASPFIRDTTDQIWYISVDAKPSIDLFLATFVAGTGYTQTQIGNAATGEMQYQPAISKNGLALYFGWDTPHPNGQADIWVMTRASTSAPFSMPILVNNVNTPTYNEKPGWISADGCRFYLTSDRPGAGLQDIYVATRPM